MEDVDKEPEKRKTTLQDLQVFVNNFEGNNAGVRHDISSREKQENNAWINQQEQKAPQDLKYHCETAQQQQKN